MTCIPLENAVVYLSSKEYHPYLWMHWMKIIMVSLRSQFRFNIHVFEKDNFLLTEGFSANTINGIIIHNFIFSHWFRFGFIFICCTSNWDAWKPLNSHYSDVIIGAMASQITNLTIAYSTVYSSAYQRKHQSSVSLSFVRGIHRWPIIPRTNDQ